MTRILIATEDRKRLEKAMCDPACSDRVDIQWAATFEAAIEAIQRARPDLLIVDARFAGRDGLELCREVLRVDAFVNMAAVSDLAEDDFHEASEGLGLIGRLPVHTGPADVERLLSQLAAVVSPNPVAPT